MNEKYVWEVFDASGNRLGHVTAHDEKTATNAASKAWFGKFAYLSTESEEA